MANLEGCDLFVEVAFGHDPFSGSLTWTDITTDVRGLTTSRGRNYELDRFDAGTATFEIDNTSGWYHSHNTASPYYPNVKPMVPIRVRIVHSAVNYPIWFGYVERWPITHPGNVESIVYVDAVDLFKPLSLAGSAFSDRPTLVAALGPVAWWRFDDDTDSSTAGTHDLTISGATTGNPGAWPVDLAGTFDGVNDFATVANESDVELLSDMSIEMWFKPQLSVSQTVTTLTSSASWVAPAGVTTVTIEAWGGGGGGGAGAGNVRGGCGGGGGGYGKHVRSVVPGVSYPVVVGTGGAGGPTAGGSDGLDSKFDGDTIGGGGDGGGAGSLGEGGAGGTSSGNMVHHNGGRGADGWNQTVGGSPGGGGGGGGGSAGLTGPGDAGNKSTTFTGGGAGGDGAGDGGNGGASTPTDGAAGSIPGGGGGGGGANSGGSDANGGNGARGEVKLTYSVAENMTPFSVRGSTFLYHFHWNGDLLKFGPSTSATASYTLGSVTPDEWHHVLVTIDWQSGGRFVRGYLDGALVLTAASAYEPAVETRAVSVGRRAQDNDQFFKGDLSEIVIYDTVLTPTDAAALYGAQLDGFETQFTGERIAHILETPEIGVGVEITDHDLDTGISVMSGPNSPTDVTALEAIGLAADTEQGQFFIAGDGRPTFRDRHYRLVEQATSIATLDQTDYETVDLLGRDDVKVLNDVRVTTSDTADPHIATDAASQATFGRRTYELTTYPDDENEGADIANMILARFAQPTDDIELLPFQMYEEVTDFPTLLAAEIGNRYTVNVPLTGDDLSLEVYLEKITHTITKTTWTMDWNVSPAGAAQSFWILGVAGSSELGETTVLGF